MSAILVLYTVFVAQGEQPDQALGHALVDLVALLPVMLGLLVALVILAAWWEHR